MDLYIRRAKVVNIVDGDTIDAIVDLGYNISTTKRFRLIGIDTPERGQEGYEEARDYLVDTILNKEVYIESTKVDSFKRYLANIFYNGSNLNTDLINLGLAKIYTR